MFLSPRLFYSFRYKIFHHQYLTPLISFCLSFCFYFILFPPPPCQCITPRVTSTGYSGSPHPDSAWLLISRNVNYLLGYVGFLVEISAGKTTVAPSELAYISGYFRVAESLTCSVLVRLSLREGLRKNRSLLYPSKQMQNNQCVRAGAMFSKFTKVIQPERKQICVSSEVLRKYK